VHLTLWVGRHDPLRSLTRRRLSLHDPADTSVRGKLAGDETSKLPDEARSPHGMVGAGRYSSTSTLNRYYTPLLRTFDCAKNHRQALDIVGADRLRRPAFAHAVDKLVDQPRMPADPILFGQRRHLQLPHLRHKAAVFFDAGGTDILAAIPFRRALGANDAPIALPTRARTMSPGDIHSRA